MANLIYYESDDGIYRALYVTNKIVSLGVYKCRLRVWKGAYLYSCHYGCSLQYVKNNLLAYDKVAYKALFSNVRKQRLRIKKADLPF